MKYFLIIVIVLAMGCTEKEFSEELIVTQGIIESDSIGESPCNIEDFAEVEGELNFQGNFSISRNKELEFEELTIEWRRDEKLTIKYYDSLGFKHAMKRGREVDLNMSYLTKVTVSEYDFGSTREYNTSGKIYFIPHQDGSLEIDWCDLDVYVWGYKAKTRGGIKIVP
jgi:hypothetical protein